MKIITYRFTPVEMKKQKFRFSSKNDLSLTGVIETTACFRKLRALIKMTRGSSVVKGVLHSPASEEKCFYYDSTY